MRGGATLRRWYREWSSAGGDAASLVVHLEAASDIDGIAVKWGIGNKYRTPEECAKDCWCARPGVTSADAVLLTVGHVFGLCASSQWCPPRRAEGRSRLYGHAPTAPRRRTRRRAAAAALALVPAAPRDSGGAPTGGAAHTHPRAQGAPARQGRGPVPGPPMQRVQLVRGPHMLRAGRAQPHTGGRRFAGAGASVVCTAVAWRAIAASVKVQSMWRAVCRLPHGGKPRGGCPPPFSWLTSPAAAPRERRGTAG